MNITYVNTYMYCINILLQRLSKTNTMIHSKLQKFRMNVTAFTMLCNFVEKSYLQWLLPPLSWTLLILQLQLQSHRTWNFQTSLPICMFLVDATFTNNIGGHGFWDRGGVYTGVCPKKILRPPLAAGIFFPPGCQNFFSAGGFISRQGCDFAKKWQKIGPQGCQKFFFLPGLWH